MKLEQRWEIPGRPLPIYYTPTDQKYCAWSALWYCSYCGKRYAEVRSWIDSHSSPWRAVGGCCLDCQGSRWMIPGSLENLTIIGWNIVPDEVIRHQLNCELSYLDAPDHPCNRKDF